jgi:hypothetical protein
LNTEKKVISDEISVNTYIQISQLFNLKIFPLCPKSETFHYDEFEK